MSRNLRPWYNVKWISRASTCGSLHLRRNLPAVFVSFPRQAKTKSVLSDPTDCSVWSWRPAIECLCSLYSSFIFTHNISVALAAHLLCIYSGFSAFVPLGSLGPSGKESLVNMQTEVHTFPHTLTAGASTQQFDETG